MTESEKNPLVNIYGGHFRDTTPVIYPAGLLTAHRDDYRRKTSELTNQHYKEPKETGSDIICKKDITLRLKENHLTYGMYNSAYDLIRPEELSPYQDIVRNLSEEVYSSRKNKIVGKTRGYVELPAFLDPMFGEHAGFAKSAMIDHLTDIISPNISREVVDANSLVGHENYVKSHHDYYAAEQKDRDYRCPFSKNTTFGIRTTGNREGMCMKRVLTSNDKSTCVLDETLALYREKRVPKLGQVLAPNDNILNIPKGAAFGKVEKADIYTTGDLLMDCDPNVPARLLPIWLKHVNSIRKGLLNRFHLRVFNYNNFYDAIKSLDEEDKGWLSKETVYNQCQQFEVRLDPCRLEPFMEYVGIIRNGMVHIESFVNLLNEQKPLPRFPRVQACGLEDNIYQTTSESAYHPDNLCIENSKLPAAGITSFQADRGQPAIAPDGIKAYYENLGAESSAKTVVNPSLQTYYDLSHRDYLKTRPKEQLKCIFQKVNNISDNQFESLWRDAIHINNGEVNVEMIRDLLKNNTNV